jgi:hypothetical protein
MTMISGYPKSAWYGLGLGLACLGLAAMLGMGSARPERPLFPRLAKASMSLGDVTQGDSKPFKFAVDNPTSQDWKIEQVWASCGCTVPKVRELEVPPGGTGTIDGVFHSHNQVGVSRSVVSVKLSSVLGAVILEQSISAVVACPVSFEFPHNQHGVLIENGGGSIRVWGLEDSSEWALVALTPSHTTLKLNGPVFPASLPAEFSVQFDHDLWVRLPLYPMTVTAVVSSRETSRQFSVTAPVVVRSPSGPRKERS